MPSGKRLNKKARRQLQEAAPGPQRIAERMLALDTAVAWMKRHDLDPVDIHDILAVAEYLEGETYE